MGKVRVNINRRERGASILLGGFLLWRSFSRGSLGGMTLAIALLYRGISGHSYLYQVLDIDRSDVWDRTRGETREGTPTIERSITVEKPAAELNRFWREPENLSKIMGDFAEVTRVDHDRAHWRIRSPLGRDMEWETQIVEDSPGKIVRWKSMRGTWVPNEISVSFRPAPRDWGTEATFCLRITGPASLLARSRGKLLRLLPQIIAEKALRRFKSLAETGEIPTLYHNPSARGDGNAS